jgi:signal transduction histidine kinase
VAAELEKQARAGSSGRPSAIDAMLDDAPCGFLSFDDDGTIELVNATLLRMLGYEREELVGSHVESILTVGSRIFYQTHLFPIVTLHGHAEEIFILLKPKGGDDLGALLNAVRRTRDGRFVTDCVLMPVRERRKFEDALLRAKKTAEEASVELQVANARLQEQAEELDRQRAIAEEANRAKSAFLAVMSHELRTPLNAIGGYAQLLDLEVHGPITKEQREALDRIIRGQRLLLRLINDLLNLARIEAGRVEYQITDLVVRDVAAAVVPMVEPQARAKRVSLETKIAAELVVRADREKLEQIVLNLLTNAIKFTPADGSVRISAELSRERPESVQVHVVDTGVGIDPDMHARIFEPFVQVGVSHARPGEGTGLGLTISRDLARGMGGDLSVESTPGVGSTFTLSLPRVTVPV